MVRSSERLPERVIESSSMVFEGEIVIGLISWSSEA